MVCVCVGVFVCFYVDLCRCRCKLGFYGENCERCIPLPGCQHGGCRSPFQCVCHKGYEGIFCQEREFA